MVERNKYIFITFNVAIANLKIKHILSYILG